ncbi:hypothetical protein PG991_000636 [Apiospora marii]
MERFTVALVAPDTAGRAVLLVPFRPSARVMAFLDELYERAARQDLPVTRLSHAVTARLNSDTGAIIDPGDVLSDVVQDPKNDTIFAVFSLKSPHQLSVRIVTAADANNPGACPVIQMPITNTLRQLRDNIADRLHIPLKFDDNIDTL